MTEKKTRAELMAEQYGKKLEELEPKKPKVHILANADRTPEEEARLAEAIEKLRDFIDLIR